MSNVLNSHGSEQYPWYKTGGDSKCRINDDMVGLKGASVRVMFPPIQRLGNRLRESRSRWCIRCWRRAFLGTSKTVCPPVGADKTATVSHHFPPTGNRSEPVHAWVHRWRSRTQPCQVITSSVTRSIACAPYEGTRHGLD